MAQLFDNNRGPLCTGGLPLARGTGSLSLPLVFSGGLPTLDAVMVEHEWRAPLVAEWKDSLTPCRVALGVSATGRAGCMCGIGFVPVAACLLYRGCRAGSFLIPTILRTYPPIEVALSYSTVYGW